LKSITPPSLEVIGRVELVTPTFSQLELVAATEAIDARESDSQSVKEEEC
jgi:hypothetical protein